MRNYNVKKSEIEIREMLDVARPFRQGGSWRLTIPSRVAKWLRLPKDKELSEDNEEVALIFIDTDKGVLVRPLDTTDRLSEPTN